MKNQQIDKTEAVTSGFANIRFMHEADRDHLTLLMRELIIENQPKLNEQETIILLESFNGIAGGWPIPLSGIPAYLADTVWTALLESPWGDGSSTLQEVIDNYDSPTDWGIEITDEPRVQLCHRLRALPQLGAVALYATVKLWWANRRNLADRVDVEKPGALGLHRFFSVTS